MEEGWEIKNRDIDIKTGREVTVYNFNIQVKNAVIKPGRNDKG